MIEGTNPIVISILTKGCGMKSRIASVLELEHSSINRGRTLGLKIELEFDPEDIPTGLDVAACPALMVNPASLHPKAQTMDILLLAYTEDLEPGVYHIEARIEHGEFHTTLSESNRAALDVLPPSLVISRIELTSEQEKYLELSVLIDSSSHQRTKVDLEMDLVHEGDVAAISKKRISVTDGTKTMVQVPRKGLRYGIYDVLVRLEWGGKTLCCANFTSGLVLKARSELEITSNDHFTKASSGQNITINLHANNIGSERCKTSINLTGSISGRDIALGESEMELEPGHAKDIGFEAKMPLDIENGELSLRVDYVLSGKRVTSDLKDMRLLVTSPHDIKVLSCLADLDFYTPGDLVVLRVYLKDEGSRPGLETMVNITIKDSTVRHRDSMKAIIGDGETLVLFEWQSPDNLKGKKLDVEVGAEGVVKDFESVIRLEEPVSLIPLLVSTKPSEVTASDPKNKEIAPYMCENESLTNGQSYPFSRKGVEHRMVVASMDSGTKMLVLDGTVCGGLEAKDIPFDHIFSYLVLTRMEPPKTISSIWQRLDHLGYLGASDLLNILEELKPESTGKQGLDISSWERTSNTLMLETKTILKGMDVHFFAIPPKSEPAPKKMDPKAKKLLDRLELAKTCLKERDVTGFDRDLDALMKGLEDLFARRIDYDRSEHDPEDARKMLVRYVAVSWLGQLPYIIKQKDIYRVAKADNYIGPSDYIELIYARMMFHVLLAQRYHIQATLDAYSNSEELRRAVSANLDLVHRLGKDLSMAFGLANTLTTNIGVNRLHRNANAYVSQKIEVATNRGEMRGTLGGVAADVLNVTNTGGQDADLVLTMALPTEDWGLVEPAFNLETDVHVSPVMTVKPSESRQLRLGVQVPKGTSLKSIKFLILRSAPRRELATLIDVRLTSEVMQLGPIKLPSSKGGIDPLVHSSLRDFMNDYHRIKFFLAHIEAHRLSRKERGIFVDDSMVFERYRRLRNIKGDSLLEALEGTGFFNIVTVMVPEGLIFKHEVESPSLTLKHSAEVSCDNVAVTWAGGSIYLSDIVMRSMLPQLRKTYRPGCEEEACLVPLPTGYQPPSIGREYLYERELPGLLEIYAKGTGSGAMNRKDYTKKYSQTMKFEGGLLANSLHTWVHCLIDSKPEVVLGHLAHGDFEAWLCSIGAMDLANVLKGFWARTKEDLKDGSARPGEVKRLLFERLDKTPLKAQINEFTIKPLVKSLSAPGSGSRVEGIERLTEIGDRTVVEPLIERLFDPQEDTRHAAIQALGRIGDKRAIVPLEKIVSYSHDATDKAMASEALMTIKAKR